MRRGNRLHRNGVGGPSVGSTVRCVPLAGAAVDSIRTHKAPSPDHVILNERQDPAVLFQAQAAKGDVAKNSRGKA